MGEAVRGPSSTSPAQSISISRSRPSPRPRLPSPRPPPEPISILRAAASPASCCFRRIFSLAEVVDTAAAQEGRRRKMAAFASALRVLPLPPAAAHPQQRRLRSREQRQGCTSRRYSKVMAYYGLTTSPYELDALEPYIRKRKVELRWGKHHQDHVDGLNKQLATSMFYGYTLEELIKEAYNNGNPLPEHNNAAQVWNHHFFWESMQPEGGGSPEGGVLQQIEKDFASLTNFREEFIRSSLSLLRSGWVWLVCKFFVFIFFEVQALLIQADFLNCCF